MNYKKSIIGSTIAFVLATSCCWLPTLIIVLGGSSSLLAFANGIEQFSGVFMAIGTGAILFGVYQFYKKRNLIMQSNEIQLNSEITCPKCSFKKVEEMPTNACRYFYECNSCKAVLKPIKGDCCVYCSYGSIACPPIQQDQNCC